MRLPKLYRATLNFQVLNRLDLSHLKIDIPKKYWAIHINRLINRGYWGLIRKGLYFVIPAGQKAGTVDKFLIGGKIAKDAVLAYRSALEFHGLARSVLSEVNFLSEKFIPSFEFQGILYKRVSVPAPIRRQEKKDYLAEEVQYLNQKIRVTTRERTLVDCIHRQALCGGIEEIIHAIQSCPSIDVTAICKYAFIISYSTLYGKIGYLLEKYGSKAGVKLEDLEPLLKKLSQYVPYLSEAKSGWQYNRRWQIFVPNELIQESVL